jgi:hypothetical protein
MNIGKIFMNAVGLRAAGHNHNGVTYGGVYYPAHTKNGKFVNARFEANMFLNRRDYTDNNGVRQEGKNEVIRIVAWNGNNSAPGKGLADTLAKCISVGKELSASLDISTYDRKVFINNQLAVDAQGNAITSPAINFKIVGDLMFGDDATSTVQSEIAAFNGQINFCSRPQYWNVQGHADNVQWKNISAQRMAAICDGKKLSYGYAHVIIPEGAQVHNAAQPLPTVSTPAPGTVATEAAATVNNNQAPTNTFTI